MRNRAVSLCVVHAICMDALFDTVLVIFIYVFMIPGSLCNAPTGYAAQGDCDPVGISDLGNQGELSREGLIARSFTDGDAEIQPQLVQIADYKIVCEVAGLARGKIRGTSVIVTYNCMGLLCGGRNSAHVTQLTSQFNFYCNSLDSTLVIEGVGHNDNPTGTTATPLDMRCGQCAAYSGTIPALYTNDTNCYHCNSECNEGQRRCLGYDTGMCCNWYFDGICQVRCPLFYRGNPETFVCEPIDNPVLCYMSLNCGLYNENDKGIEGSFSIQNETASCCTSGYEFFSIAATERCLPCVDTILIPIIPTPGGRTMNACNVPCTVGIFAGVIITLGVLWCAAAAIGYTFTRLTAHRPVSELSKV